MITKFLNKYQQLTDEAKAKLFTTEQQKIINGMIFFNKMFTDPQFYTEVQTAVGEEVYHTLRGER